MVNESLGTICNAHVVHADLSVYGAMDENCLKLKQGELKEKLKLAYNTLRKEFRNVFEHMDSGFDQLSDNEKNTMYEQKVLAWYQVTYHPSWMKRSLEFQVPDGVSETVMLSFPWIAADYLAWIKVKCRGIGSVNSTKPIDSLVRYLADRI